MKNKSVRLVWLLLAAVALATAGCGGMSGSYQASPASLLLLKNDPKPAPSPVPVPAAAGQPAPLLSVD